MHRLKREIEKMNTTTERFTLLDALLYLKGDASVCLTDGGSDWDIDMLLTDWFDDDEFSQEVFMDDTGIYFYDDCGKINFFRGYRIKRGKWVEVEEKNGYTEEVFEEI